MITIAKLQKTIMGALEDIKAKEIEAYDVRHLTSLFDRVIIASADSGRQLKALSSNVQAKVKAAGGTIISVEGTESDEWMLVDTGDIVVHIMQPAVRTHYNLEELWDQPKPRVRRTTPAKSAAKSATKPAAADS